jgi:hypothetical protein
VVYNLDKIISETNFTVAQQNSVAAALNVSLSMFRYCSSNTICRKDKFFAQNGITLTVFPTPAL